MECARDLGCHHYQSAETDRGNPSTSVHHFTCPNHSDNVRKDVITAADRRREVREARWAAEDAAEAASALAELAERYDDRVIGDGTVEANYWLQSEVSAGGVSNRDAATIRLRHKREAELVRFCNSHNDDYQPDAYTYKGRLCVWIPFNDGSGAWEDADATIEGARELLGY